MKYLIFLILLSSCATQKVDTGREFSLKQAAAGAALSAISGACWGFHETSVHHPDKIPAGWNKQFWDNRQSWRNKYRNGDPEQGPKYVGSTTFLAWTTDAKHLFGTAHRATLFGSAVVFTIGEKRPAWHYLADIGIGFLSFSAGFHSVYTIGFK